MEGYYKNNVYYYKGLPDDLDKLTTYDAIKNIINPPLSDNQSIDLLKALFVKRFAALYSTGLGKTYLATAYVRALKNKDPNTKILFWAKKSQEDQTPKKISSISGLKCKFLSSTKFRLLEEEDITNNDIIIMTHDCLNSVEHMTRLYSYMDRFTGMIIDEAHLLSNLEGANSAFMLYSISHEVEYVLALTATPITTEVEQIARLLKVIAPADVGSFKKIGSEIKRFGLGALPKGLFDLFEIRDRGASRRVGLAVFVDAMGHQIGADGRDLFIITKGPGAVAQENKLIELIEERSPLRGIIYANRTIIQNNLAEVLNSRGINCGLINGYTSKEKRVEILSDFKDKKYRVIITNSKESLDMDCDFVIFYEYTPHVQQVIGRAERGLNPKPLDVIFIFTRDTGEYDYFMRNVFAISQEIQEILNLDNKEVTNLKIERSSSFSR